MSDNLHSDPLAEINSVLGLWRSSALTSLHVSQGSLELLRRGLVGDVNDEQRSLLERTLHHIQDATACWLHLSHYLILHSSVDAIEWRVLVLEDEIEQMLLRLQRTTPLQHIEVILPSTLPLVRGTDWLQQAMINLLYPLDQSPKFYDRIPTINIWAIDAATIGIQITTGHCPILIRWKNLSRLVSIPEAVCRQLHSFCDTKRAEYISRLNHSERYSILHFLYGQRCKNRVAG